MIDSIDITEITNFLEFLYNSYILEPVVFIIRIVEKLPDPGADSIYWLYVFITVLTIILAPLLLLVYGSLGSVENDIDSFIISNRFPALKEYIKSVVLLFFITLLWQTPSNTVKLLISPIVLYHLISLCSYILGLSQWITQKDSIRERHVSLSNLIAHGSDPYHYATIKWYWQQFFSQSNDSQKIRSSVKPTSISTHGQLELFFQHIDAMIEQKEWEMAVVLLEIFAGYIKPEQIEVIFDDIGFQRLLTLYNNFYFEEATPADFKQIVKKSLLKSIDIAHVSHEISPALLLSHILESLTDVDPDDLEYLIEYVFNTFPDTYVESHQKVSDGFIIDLDNLLSESPYAELLLKSYMKFVHTQIHQFAHQQNQRTHYYKAINLTHAIFGNLDYGTWNLILLYTLFPNTSNNPLQQISLLHSSVILSQNELVFSLFPEDKDTTNSSLSTAKEQTIQIAVQFLSNGFEHLKADLAKLITYMKELDQDTFEYLEAERTRELFKTIQKDIQEFTELDSEIDEEDDEESE